MLPPAARRLLLWSALATLAAVLPAWLMPAARPTYEVRAEVQLPELEHPEYVTEAGEFAPPADAATRPTAKTNATPKPRSHARPTTPVATRATAPPATSSAATSSAAPLAIPAIASPPPVAAVPRTTPPPAKPIDPAVATLGRLSQRYWKLPSQRPAFQSELDAAARRVFFDPTPHLLPPQTVQPGDRLATIAQRYSVSWGYLATLNRVRPERLQVGQMLKVHRGPFAAIVEKGRYRATIHSRGYYVASFPVAIGRDNRTPVGTFVVREKVTNPAWHGPDETIAADDPSNPLGERWIGLEATGATPPVAGLGLHGTINPASIGTAASGGCLRLHPADIEQVFDLLVEGSAVEIRP